MKRLHDFKRERAEARSRFGLDAPTDSKSDSGIEAGETILVILGGLFSLALFAAVCLVALAILKWAWKLVFG